VPNKAQFVEMLAERLDGDRKRAAAALDAVIDSVYATVARGEKVAITGFGVFERRERAARTARNPATGARVDVAASRVPAFRPGAEFRAITNGARELTHERTARAQAAVTKATSALKDAAEAVRDVPAKAAAAVKKSGSKSAKKASKKAAAATKAAKKAAKSTAPATKAPAKRATKAAPAKKAAATKSAPAKKTAQKATKKAAKKAPAKKAAKKAPAKKK
jgi:DNA-binding protein HU-beta